MSPCHLVILSQDADRAVIPQHQPIGARFERRAGDFDIAADQAIFEAVRQFADDTVLEYDRVLDLAALDQAVVIDRGEWADVAVDDPRMLANNRRAADGAVDDLGALFDNHLADQLRVAIDVSLYQRRQFFQNQPVGLEHIVLLTVVDPPALVDVREHLLAMLDEPLNRVGDLQLAAPGWLNRLDRLPDAGVKHIDADQRQIGSWRARLLCQPHDPALVV